MFIDRINPNLFALPTQKVNPAFGATQPIEPLKHSGEAHGVDPVFARAVQSFSQRSNPFNTENLSFKGIATKYENGLSPLGQGALGENALYTKNGRLGRDLNLIG